MGRRRPRTLLLGLVAALVAFGSQQAAGSAPPASSRVVRGGVSASGEAPGALGWTLEHPAEGIYRITIPAGDVDLDVPEWDKSADVTILPLGGGAVEVRFSAGRRLIDSDFSFVALVGG